MIKNVLVNGCSFSRGPGSWPYHLKKKMDFNLVNLAQAAAGNFYIHNTTISEIVQRSYDLVIIMWSGLERIDVQVEDISLFKQTVYTSYSQSKLNDWPEKIVYPINDQDYVEKNWVFGGANQDKYLHSIKFADTQYRYVGLDQNIQQSLIHMISLQSILKQMNIPYLFTFYRNYIPSLEEHFLFRQLDTSNIYTDQNIHDIANKHNSFQQDGQHPGTTAHKMWADLLEIKLHEYDSK
jgi:hypothetical protein